MFSVKELSNGIKVAIEPISYVRSISFGIWVRNGSVNEPENLNGISHFIEHMLFKGTYKRTARDIAEEMDAVGGQINAYTTKEYTCFHTRTLDKHFDIALDVMSDMFLNSKFDEDDIKRERNVIIEEINMYEDTPDDLVHDSLQSKIWSGNSLGQPILGTEKTISAFTRDTFLDYMRHNYHTNNTVLAVAGNFNEDEMLSMLERYFGSFKPEAEYLPYTDAVRYKKCVNIIKKDIEQLHLCMAFPCVKRDDPYKYAYVVFNTIFGGGMSSKLFQRIREENGLTYSVYSFVSAYSETGIFCIYAGMSPSQTKRVIELIFEEIEAVKRNGLSQDLIKKTKEQIISNFIMGSESTLNRMTSMGGSIMVRGRVQPMEEVIDQIESVSIEDINHVIDTIFDFNALSISAVGNVKGINFEKIFEKGIKEASK